MPYDPYDEEGDYYYTLPSSAGDRFAAGSGNAVAFDEPTANGIRFPIATPRGGSWNPTPEEYPGIVTTRAASDAAYASRDLYNAELARAERNRAEEQAAEDPQAVQQAVRMKGLLKYQQLLRDGTNPAEAMRLAAPELYFNHPMAQVQATRQNIPTMLPQISTVPVPGGNAILSNGKLHSVLKTPAPPRELKPTIPADAKFAVADASAEVNDLDHAIRSLNDEVAKGRMDEAEAAPRIAELMVKRDAARKNRMTLSTNWMGRASIPLPAETPSAKEVVRVTKDGRKAIFDAETKKFLRYAQ